MPDDDEIALLQEQLTEARAEVERLQIAAADAEARALSLAESNAETRGRLEVVEDELSTARRRLDETVEELSDCRSELAARQEETQELHARLLAAAGKYREVLLAAAPELPEELVAGDSIEDVDASAERARQTVQQVRQRMESQARGGRVPTGSPPRSAPDLSALSPIEKIRLGLARNS